MVQRACAGQRTQKITQVIVLIWFVFVGVVDTAVCLAVRLAGSQHHSLSRLSALPGQHAEGFELKVAEVTEHKISYKLLF